MPRMYNSRSSRPYKRYDPLILKAAVEAYRAGNQSLLQIAKEYNIGKSVLHRHVTRNMKNQGGQRCIGEEVERYIIKYINICSEWGYPLDILDLRLIIKGYLDRLGLQIKRFNNNLPGRDYVECFLKRYNKEISQRISENIKRSRTAVAPPVIEDYFKELQISLEGVPLCNIVNYDESNLADDPGKKKVLTKRGVKYPERVMNHSKSSTSLMMAAAADGTLLPCYVVYKATHLYNTWTSNGPTNCRYNRTPSGWFDSNTFEDWIDTVALPYFNSKNGKKLLIGDNLSSHLSIDVIKKCQEQNVHFVFLPPNSTHLTQPLDVALFRPMKMAWRDILFTWKKTEGRTLPSIPKNIFPRLLKRLLERMLPNVKLNILAGFSKTGISPFDTEKVLSRLPGNNSRHELSTEEKDAVDESVLCLLKEMSYGSQTTMSTKKLKKLNIKPAKSVEDSDYVETDISSSNSVLETSKGKDDDSNCSVEIPAEVWNFFERDEDSDPGRARCILCSATVSLLDMMEHMKNEHPKEFEAEDDTLNDSKEKDGFDTEIIYVQDNSGYKKKLPPKRRQSRNFNVDRKRVSKYLCEEEDEAVEVPFKKTKHIEKDDEEIDNFTTYVRCLLKQLPKDVCAKLQMDIINLIMTAKLKIPQQNAPETSKPMSSNMITVTSVDGTYMLVPPSVEKSVTVPTSDASERHNESGRTDPTADS